MSFMIRLHVIEEMSDLPGDVRDYLKRCGLPDSKLLGCSEGTRMYQDLGLYGDTAEAYMDVLAKEYYVDLRNFQFERYFPSEFQGRTFASRVLLWLVPFASSVARRRGNYQALTLGMIDRAIRTKRWEA